MKRLYLDYAAATPLRTEVQKAMREAMGVFANPSANYQSARDSKALLSESRKKIAMFFNANGDEIIFTSGATESNNIAILGAARAARRGKIISVATEHASVYEPLAELEKDGFEVVICKVDSTGKINLSDFEKQLSIDTILVTLSLANSEIGTIAPLTKISKLISSFEAHNNNVDIVLHTDASAAVSQINCDVSRLGVDLLTASSAKIYGPKSGGLLYVKRGTKIAPILFGGKQENQLRPGSEDIVQIAGFAKALELAQKEKQKLEKKYSTLFLYATQELEKLSEIGISSKAKETLHNIINICVDGYSGEDLVARLDAMGVEVSTGAACEVGEQQPSRVLQAIGLNSAQAQSSLRISFGTTTNTEDIDYFIASLKSILHYNTK